MGKLLKFFDEQLLKWGVAFAIAFTVLYPKLPSIGITHTWVYIRLEDFVIVALVGIWFIQLLRRKIQLPFPLAQPIVAYWIAGLLSLVFCLLFIGPHLANFFPSVATLSYIRRIEYMILFFVAASTVHSEKDIWDYIKIIFITLTAVILYGFGQRWYILLWGKFPAFFEKYSFCFPSFQTGNEEFAKGIPLCLPSDARITSTFGGHYDLAGYLVLVLPVIFGVFFSTKNILGKIYAVILSIGATILLIFTASRISFVAYLVGISTMLIFIKQKKYILPVIIVSIVLLLSFSSGTAKRFLETIRITNVVTNSQGQVVGVAETNLAPDLRNKISKNPIIVAAPTPSQNLPQGSSFIPLPQLGGQPVKTTNVAVVQTAVPQDKLNKLSLKNGGVAISTINGTFLVKQALVYDISFTTRFQGEWPTAWNAFMRNPILGSGYSSISLATDSDYFRVLGETGLLGLITFAAIFMYFGILLRTTSDKIQATPGLKYMAYGLAGGIIGLFVNASFIDIFEASKIAEPLWLLSGIAAGGILIYAKGKQIDYIAGMKRIYTSAPLMFIYFATLVGIIFFKTINNFFVADDFTWLRWAASSNLQDLKNYFTNAQGFFYRPIDKLFIFVLYSLSAFYPGGYHLAILLLHLMVGIFIYVLLKTLFQKKLLAFLGAIFFLVSPSHGENIYWISSMSPTIATLFILLSIIAWISFEKSKSAFFYISSCILGILALLSYEMAIIFPGLLLLTDILFFKKKKTWTYILLYVPFAFILGAYLFLRHIVKAVWLGGDYAYSGVHAIQNIFGNLFGYLGLFFVGENFLPAYTSLRDYFRQQPTIILGIAVIFMLIIISVVWKYRKSINILRSDMNVKMMAYGIGFALISLAPFILLGNISERYIYLASIGFIIFSIGIIKMIVQISMTKFGSKIGFIFLGALAVLFIFYVVQVQQESDQWKHAGNITNNTLSLLRANYADVPKGKSPYLYFVNTPIRYKNAWVFPVGLSDGAWFIYGDADYHVFEIPTIQQAKNYRDAMWNNPKKEILSHIFVFNKDGELSEVQ